MELLSLLNKYGLSEEISKILKPAIMNLKRNILFSKNRDFSLQLKLIEEFQISLSTDNQKDFVKYLDEYLK